jgi:hypothetical protein
LLLRTRLIEAFEVGFTGSAARTRGHDARGRTG